MYMPLASPKELKDFPANYLKKETIMVTSNIYSTKYSGACDEKKSLYFLQKWKKDMNDRYIWYLKLFRGLQIVTFCYK